MGFMFNFFFFLDSFEVSNCNHGTRKKNLIESLLCSYGDGLWYEYDL
jgi:hypothetical protein